VALELLQAYFLIHDDWMDEDHERRGGPTAHVALSQILGSTHLGERAAILAGDFAVALAQQCWVEIDVPAKNLVSASEAFARMQKSAVLGQQLDVVAQGTDPELTYELKTASYTVQGPLEVGVRLAGGNQKLQNALGRYARPAGIAFQLRDDMLGLFGDPSVTGKPRGADLLAGKKTAFLQLATKALPSRSRKLLEAVYGQRRASAKKVQAALEMLAECETYGQIEQRILELKRQALRALGSPTLSPGGRALLSEATEVLITRSF
jgi:geranylgeranyl diphosphate synthase, type I